MKNVHLFFDVYVEDAPLGVYLRGDRRRFEADREIRVKQSQYRYQTKLDITRYTLYSYACLKWQSVTIRMFCENQEHVWVYDEIRSIFPNALIERFRSDTSEHFSAALKQLSIPENDWVFFSTNNDHPFLANPIDLERVVAEVDALEESVLSGKQVAILYSHFTESNNMDRITSPLWGHYGGIFPKCIFENKLFNRKLQKRYLIRPFWTCKIKIYKSIS